MELDTSIYQQAPSSTSPAYIGQKSKAVSTQTTVEDSSPRGRDTVDISQAGKDRIAARKEAPGSTQPQASNSVEFTQEDLATLTKLKSRDVEVRAHEQAHLSAAGGHATGGASFTYQKGPDGQSYAVGGEVGIDLSSENDPNATIQKMQTIKRAALAPASPSSTDRQVAAQASIKEAQARQEITQEQQEQLLQTSPASEVKPKQPSTNSNTASPSISALKASIASYELISAM
ncbi:MAG: hypothetical protein ACI8ZB_000945 [Desulforhopalus sp.]|jgi:hypothetical protein